mmetsp:Transcript_7295/g.13645  ORF Transcript_7295/g.13645 Transcript_7295/m.13645 type:complete len:611 (-) Transcript_7295:137-1969(-)
MDALSVDSLRMQVGRLLHENDRLKAKLNACEEANFILRKRNKALSNHLGCAITTISSNAGSKNGVTGVTSRVRAGGDPSTGNQNPAEPFPGIPEAPGLLCGHSKEVNSVGIISSNLVASGSSDRTVRVWNLETRKCICVFRGHTAPISQVCGVGGLVVSCSWDKSVRVWDVRSGQCSQVLLGHSSWVWCGVAISRSCLASGSCDNTIRIWNAVTGECKRVLIKHKAPVVDLCMCGKDLLASCSRDRTVVIWRPSSGQAISLFESHAGFVTSIASLQNGLIASASWDQSVRFTNAMTGECLRICTGHKDAVLCVIRVNETVVASSSRDNTVRLWNAASGECLKVLKGHTDSVTKVCRISDRVVASCGRDGDVRVWEVRSGECISRFQSHETSILSLENAPGGLLVSGDAAGAIGVWSLGECLERLLHVCEDEIPKSSGIFQEFAKNDDRIQHVRCDEQKYQGRGDDGRIATISNDDMNNTYMYGDDYSKRSAATHVHHVSPLHTSAQQRHDCQRLINTASSHRHLFTFDEKGMKMAPNNNEKKNKLSCCGGRLVNTAQDLLECDVGDDDDYYAWEIPLAEKIRRFPSTLRSPHRNSVPMSRNDRSFQRVWR